MENFNLKEVIEKLNEINTNSVRLCSLLQEVDVTHLTKFSERMTEIGNQISQNISKLDFESINASQKAFAENIKIKEGYYISTVTGYHSRFNYEPIPIEHSSVDDFYICQN